MQLKKLTKEEPKLSKQAKKTKKIILTKLRQQIGEVEDLKKASLVKHSPPDFHATAGTRMSNLI
jgi:hypothetical protein